MTRTNADAARHCRRPERRSSTRRATTGRATLAAVVALSWWLALSPAAVAQTSPKPNIQYTENKADLGLRSERRVDPSTLALGVSVPLGAYPGRAGHGLAVGINYSSKVWRIDYSTSYSDHSGYHSLTDARFAEHSAAGWTSSLDPPRIQFTALGQLYNNLGDPSCTDCPVESGQGQPQEFYIKRIHAHMPGGSSHELRVDDTPHLINQERSNYDLTGTFRAVDDSRLRFESSASGPSVLHLPDGSRYVFGPYSNGADLVATQHVDRHGNTLSYDPASRVWTDTLGRTFGLPLPATPAAGDFTYSLPGVEGATVPYTFRWRRLSDAGVLTVAGQQLRRTGSHDCSSIPPGPVAGDYLFDSVFPDYVCGGDPFDPVVLWEVSLPTGLKHRFTYNVYGEIDKVHLPTGGYERYAYERVGSVGYMQTQYARANRGVTRRHVSARGDGSDEVEWQYSAGWDANASAFVATTTNPEGTRSERRLHNSNGSAVNSPDYGFDTVLAGMPYEERVVSPGGVALRRTLTGWQVSGPMEGGDPAATRLPRVTKQVNVLLDTGSANALAAVTVNRYEQASQPLNLTSTTEYAYDSSKSRAAAEGAAITDFNPGDDLALRTTETAYLDDPAYRERNLVMLPLSVTVRAGMPASGTVAAFTRMGYDEAGYAPLPCGAGVGWAGPGAAQRGDVTTVGRRLFTAGGGHQDLETHTRYDECGSVRQSQDANGNLSQVEYSAASHYAYPSKVITPAPDADGSNGSSDVLEVNKAYDFQTGRVMSMTDAGGRTTSYSFSDEQGVKDPLGRLRRVTRPDGGWTKYDYGDSPGDLFVRSRTLLDAAGGVERHTDAYQYLDGLGRPSRSFSYDGSAPDRTWVVADTEYDTAGRVQQVSNPYFVEALGSTGTAEEVMWTESEYDDLGRVESVTTPDEAQVVTSYAGNEVTVTDQAGRKRASVTDALGRLTRVVEAPGVQDYGYVSEYGYDVLDNLTAVRQGVGAPVEQARAFVYDSLSRLILARNPEQDATLSDARAAGPWSVSYAYDAGGNLKVRTDARWVRADYEYDALNRPTRRAYSVTPGHEAPPDYIPTPAVESFYDGTGMPEEDGVPLPVPGGAKGLLTAVKSSVSEVAYTEFDAGGRVKKHRQLTASAAGGPKQHYKMEYTYDLAGGLTSQTYPSGKVVRTDYDAAGRVAGVKDNSSAHYYAGGAAADADKRIRYAAHGAVSALRLGNGLWEHTNFNSRLQPERIGLGASAADSSLLRLDYAYGAADNNGNVRSQRILIAGSLDLTQSYDYDAVNRLQMAREAQTADPAAEVWKQTFSYLDQNGQNGQFGNRRVNPDHTTANVLPPSNPQVDPSTNRISNGQGYSYDPAGNLVGEPGGRAYDYDAENRLTAVNGGVASGVGAEYAYDGEGRRVRKATLAETIVFVYDAAGRLVAEYSSQPTAQGTTYVTQDTLGSTRAATGADGQPSSRYDYLPFGEDLDAGVGGRMTNQGYSRPDPVTQRFTGKERDGETGLDYFGARYYASPQGRFTGVDPGPFTPADPQNFNRYGYVQNNPLKFIDPTGEELAIVGADADYILSALERFTGYKLKRDKRTGIVTIDESKKRVTAKTSKTLADTLKNVIGLEKDGRRVTVTLNVVRNFDSAKNEVLFDQFSTRSVDVNDFKAADKNAPELSAAILGHVLEEYAQAETTFKHLAPYGRAQELASHEPGLVTEGKVLSDFTGKGEGIRRDLETKTIYFFYTSVQYDIERKSQTGAGRGEVTNVIRKAR